jgi:hypothetical protein
MTKVRPSLIRSDLWGKGSLQNVFPQNVVAMMDKFLESTCSGQLNPTVIRNTMCQAFDEIKEDSKFFPFRDRLQYTAAHRTDKSKVIVQNYTLKFKIEQEQRLQSYIDETFYQPALSTVKFILSQPRIKKRKRALIVTEEKDENSDQDEESREELYDEQVDPVFKVNQLVNTPFGEAKLMEETDGGWNVRFKGYPDKYYYDTEEIKAIEPPVLTSLAHTIAKPHPVKPQPSPPRVKQKSKHNSPLKLTSALGENDHEEDVTTLLQDITVEANNPHGIEDSQTVQSHDIGTKKQTLSGKSMEDDEQATAEMDENSESHDRLQDDTSEAPSISEEKLPIEIETVMKTLLQAAYRNSYLIRGETIESVIREACTQVYPLTYNNSKDFDTDEFRNLRQLALTRARLLVKNWTNTSPVKAFAAQMIEKKVPRNVKSLKQICSKKEVELAFQRHFCFRTKKGYKFDLSDDQLRRVRKDVEQRVLAHDGQTALAEVPGKKPDKHGHIGGLKAWRLTNFTFDRFEDIDILDSDENIPLGRDYRLKKDKRTKKNEE